MNRYDLYPVMYLGGTFPRFYRPGTAGLLQTDKERSGVAFAARDAPTITLYDRKGKLYSPGEVHKRGGLFHVTAQKALVSGLVTYEAFFQMIRYDEDIEPPVWITMWDDSPNHSEWD